MNKTCGTCLFWRRAQPMQPLGNCQARPPVPLTIGMMQNKITGQTQPMIDSFWPMTPDTEWCGHWTLRPSAVDMKALDLDALDEKAMEGNA